MSTMDMQSSNASKQAQEAFAKNSEENRKRAEETAKVPSTVYYSRISGCTYIFKDGTKAVFAGGEYITDRQVEIEELEDLCKRPHNFLICKEPVIVQNAPDYVLLREVSKEGVQESQVVPGATHTGMVHSAALAALAASRGQK
jgi:hypothetical protein